MTGVALSAFRELESRYRESAVARPAPDPHVMQWVGTYLEVAGFPLLVGTGELDEIIETPEVARIPGTRPWVLGLAAHEGGLLPIISGDSLFRGKAHVGRPREYSMVVRRPGFHFGITLSAVYRDLKFPLQERDMQHPVDPDIADYCLGGFHAGKTFLPVLDIDKLVSDARIGSAAIQEEPNEEYSA